MRRVREELPALTGNPRWSTLRAVRDARVSLANGKVLQNGPGRAS
jgi:ABC-type Fe3+-hydroxamate transport system substrate-binding protein